jgi:hypothetical protein
MHLFFILYGLAVVGILAPWIIATYELYKIYNGCRLTSAESQEKGSL